MNFRTAFRRWNAYQQTVRELSALDNRALADLGILRVDIARLAHEHVAQL